MENTRALTGIVIDPGHQGIGVSQIWWIAIKPSKYKDDLFKNRLSFLIKIYILML